MADDYWEHPARRETKRLIDLGDAGAILDELQNRETEWDDAREALDHLVRGSRAEVERLRAELATDHQALDRAAADHAQLRVEQVETRHDRDRLAEQVKRVRDRHPHKTDDADCMDADTTLGCQHGPGYHVVEYCGTCDEEWPCAEIRALDGTEAGR